MNSRDIEEAAYEGNTKWYLALRKLGGGEKGLYFID